METCVTNTKLWQKTLGQQSGSQYQSEKETLRVALEAFRKSVAILASRISASLPGLTMHDVTHLDALWEIADIIAGENYPLNPMEAFVFGGAVLLHDAAQCFEAYEGGLDGVRRTLEWRDAWELERERNPRGVEAEQISNADFSAIRVLHARQARELAVKGWKHQATGSEIFLIENYGLRSAYGDLIGQIAESHNWSIEDMAARLPSQVNAPGNFPANWRVDAVKIACLLRCADAGHMDDRRAPDFLFALLRRSGISFEHWNAQNSLARLDIDQSDTDGKSIVITSSRAFKKESATAWWVAYDAVALLDAELRSSNALLRARPQKSLSPPFRVTQVTGANSPEELSRHIKVDGWLPTLAKIHVGNVEKLVASLGGANLYGEGGDHFEVVIRELIQNARDAVVARRSIERDYKGKITVKFWPDGDTAVFFAVEDDGVGMSERVLTESLLDFGTSFWATDLVRSEFPGLKASSFRSVGKFGIGFYSVFMIAKGVEVASRRYDKGLVDVGCLQFPTGISLRPIFSKGRPTHFGSFVSTLILCRLSGRLEEYSTRKISYNVMGYEDFTAPVQSYLAALVAGLDVRVELAIEGEEPIVIHEPLSDNAEFNERVAWLKRIGFVGYQQDESVEQYIAANSHRLREVSSGDRVLGFAALSHRSTVAPDFLGKATIGGLANHISSFAGSNSYLGFIDHATRSAKRDASKISVPEADLQVWADEQITLIRAMNCTPLEWCYVTNNVAKLGLDPLNILHAPFFYDGNFRALNIDEIYELLSSTSIAFIKGVGDYVEGYARQNQYDAFPTFKSQGNGGEFGSLEFDGAVPKFPKSFVGCIYRHCKAQGRELEFETREKVSENFLGPADVLLVSLKK